MSIFRTNNPMQFAEVDGIVIDETAAEPSIRGVGTGLAILVGTFNKGPTNQMIEPGSQERIIETFGNDSSGYDSLRNKRFARLKIIRVAPTPGVKATLNLNNGSSSTTALTLNAKNAGVSGNTISAIVEAGSNEGRKYTFKQGDTTEVYDDIVVSAIDETTFAASALVDVVIVDITEELATVSETNLAGGVDEKITDDNYLASIKVAEAQNAGNILFLDVYNDVRNAALKVHAGITQDKDVILAGPEDETVAEVKERVESLRDTDGRLYYAFNWPETLIGSVPTFVSPASFLASLISQTPAHIDPAAARNSGLLYGITRLKQDLTRADYIQLHDAGVAAFEFDPDIGFKLKSGITTQIANPDKTTIVRRRMADYLTNSIGRYLKLYQNDINSLAGRTAVKAAIMDFIQRQVELGILPGDNEVEGGRASIVDTEVLNSNESIAREEFFISYKQRIYSAMRYIVLKAQVGKNIVITEGE